MAEDGGPLPESEHLDAKRRRFDSRAGRPKSFEPGNARQSSAIVGLDGSQQPDVPVLAAAEVLTLLAHDDDHVAGGELMTGALEIQLLLAEDNRLSLARLYPD